MLRKLLVFLAGVVILAATQATALGLGDIRVESSLNQPLSGRIELVDVGNLSPEDIEVELASDEDFSRFSLDRPYFLQNLDFRVESSGGSQYIRVTSREPVQEPYLSFVVDTSWPNGRLLTEYTVLLDPPASANQSSGSQTQPPASQASPDPDSGAASGDGQAGQTAADEPAAQQGAQPLADVDPAPDGQSGDDAAPPEEEPQPSTEEPAPQPDTDSMAAPDTVEVTDADTLWSIAAEVRPDNSVSVQQTMLALQRVNPDAFMNDNINLLRGDAVLRVPDRDEIERLAGNQAVSEVQRQNQALDEGSAPAASQPLSEPPDDGGDGQPEEQGELTVVTDEDIPEPVDDAAISEVRSQSNELSERIESLEDRLAVNQDELARVESENEELTESLGMLEEQIASAQEIIELRDQELAQLQEEVSGAGPQGTDSGGEEPGAGQDTEVTMASEAGPVERLTNTVIQNTWALGALAGLLVLLLVLAMLRRNRANRAQLAAEQAGGAVDEDPEEQQLFAAVGDELSSAGDRDALSELEEYMDREEGVESPARSASQSREQDEGHGDETQELLGEVEALMDLQKYDQASSVLQNAIVAEPNRAELRLKLLEVHVANGDPVSFSLQEAELARLEDADVQARVDELRRQLPAEDSGDADSASDEAGDSMDFEAYTDTGSAEIDEGTETSGSGESRTDSTIEMADESFSDLDELELELDMDASAEVDDEKVRSENSRQGEFREEEEITDFQEPAQEPESGEEDDEWSLLDPDQATDSDAGHKAEAADETQDDDPDFDLDLELAALDEGGDSQDAGTGETETQPSPDESAADTDTGTGQSPGEETREDQPAGSDDDDLDIDLDNFELGEPGTDTSSSATTADGAQEREPGQERSGASAKTEEDPLDDLEFSGEEPAPAETAASAEDEDESFDFLSGSDEAGTKLDLARAYIDMGDEDGAREILEEVLQEGSEEQARDARELVDRLKGGS